MSSPPFGTLAQVFVSYAHADISIVRDLMRRIASRLRPARVEIFFDQADRPAEDVDGLSFGLSSPMASAGVFLVFVSAAYVASRWCRAELEAFAGLQVAKRKGAQAFGKALPPGRIVAVAIEERAGIEEVFSGPVTAAMGAQAVLCTKHRLKGDGEATTAEVAQEILECVALLQRDLDDVVAETPQLLWSRFAEIYPWLPDVPISEVIAGYRALTTPDSAVMSRIEKYRSAEVMQLLTHIRDPWISIFSRAVGRQAKKLEWPLGNLVSVGRSGVPVNVLVAMWRDSAIGLPEVQYTYYHCLLTGHRHWSIDTAALAALAITFDAPTLGLGDSFRTDILEPLQAGADLCEIRWGVAS